MSWYADWRVRPRWSASSRNRQEVIAVESSNAQAVHRLDGFDGRQDRVEEALALAVEVAIRDGR